MRSVWLVPLVGVAACGFTINTGTSLDAADGTTRVDGDVTEDAPDPSDAPMLDGSPAMWGPPQVLGFAGTDDPTLTGDLLQIWVDQGGDIFHASRFSTSMAFGAATEVFELSENATETTPEVTPDGLTITLGRLVGNNDIYLSTWDNAGSWSMPASMLDFNTTDHEQAASLSADRLMIAFTRSAPAGTSDIYFSTRGNDTDSWSNATAATELNSSAHDGSVHLVANKLTVCFDSNRNGGPADIYCATRSSPLVAFDPPFPMTAINSPQSDQDPWLSPDGNTMVFWSDRDGTGKLWIATRN